MSFRVPVTTQEPVITRQSSVSVIRSQRIVVPNTGGSGGISYTVPQGWKTRILGCTAFVQYDSAADAQQYTTLGIDMFTSRGLMNTFSVYEHTYVAPTTLYRYSAFPGADAGSRDVITAAGVTTRSQTRPIPDLWLPGLSRIYWTYNNFNANDDGIFQIIYEEIEDV